MVSIDVISGLIGQSWAMLFAASHFDVAIYDVISENVDKALVSIDAQLQNLESKGLLRGKINAKQQFALIRKADSLEDCLQNAIHVQVFLIPIYQTFIWIYLPFINFNRIVIFAIFSLISSDLWEIYLNLCENWILWENYLD